jgi:hypothetical protein
MKFKAELLEGELGWKDRGEPAEGEVEIFNVEENELVLRTFSLDGGQEDYTLLKTTLQIGVDEIFLYGWLKSDKDVFKVRYKLKPIKL